MNVVYEHVHMCGFACRGQRLTTGLCLNTLHDVFETESLIELGAQLFGQTGCPINSRISLSLLNPAFPHIGVSDT